MGSVLSVHISEISGSGRPGIEIVLPPAEKLLDLSTREYEIELVVSDSAPKLDTLDEIARLFYGSADASKGIDKLRAANEHLSDIGGYDRLRDGTTVRIPLPFR